MFKHPLPFCLRLSCSLLFAVTVAVPQSAWKQLGVNDGLAQGQVNAVFEDSRGFLWFGTKEGLSRYDGYTFKNYRNDPGDSTTIFSDLVTDLHECPSGLIWVGFLTGAIDVFDRTTESFLHLRQFNPAAALHPTLGAIVEDNDGVHWIIRGPDILRVEGAATPGMTLSITSFDTTKSTIVGEIPENRSLSNVFRDHTGGIWIWYNKTLHVINRSVPRIPDFEGWSYSPQIYILATAEDRDGIIWFFIGATGDYRVYSFDPETAELTRHTPHIPRTRSYVWPHVSANSRFVWLMGTEEIVRFEPRNPEAYEVIQPPVAFDPSGEFIESRGLLWIGTNGYGIERYNPAIERFGMIPKMGFYDLAANVIKQIGFPRRHDDTQKTFPDAGLYDFFVFRDRGGKDWFPWNPMTRDPNMYPMVDTAAVQCYDPVTRAMKRFPRQKNGEPLTPHTFPVSPPVKLLEDRTGARWFIGGNVLSVYDTSRSRFRHFTIRGRKLVPDPEVVRHDEISISAVRKDQDGTFWLCVERAGLFRFDPLTLELRGFFHDANDPASLSSNNALSMAEDPAEPSRFLWVGTDGGGLNRFEKSTGRSTRFSLRDGLPNNVIYTVFPDKQGKLWMSTNNGLCEFDPKAMTFQNFDIQDGLQGMEFNRNKNYQAPDGRIYLEGTEGLNVFDPEDLTGNPHVPPVVLTDFKLYGKSVSSKDASSPLKRSISETKEIVLSFDQNIITLEFVALDFSNPGRNRYSYKLEGFSEQWTNPSNERVATFTNLNPGSYTLKVRGSNNDGVWNETGASLSLIVLPPWYRTWWAYGGYAGLLLTGLLLFRRYDLKRIRLKDQLDIEFAKSEQLKEIDQLKMRFFQNISHEFRTPLTLILGPIEKLLGNAVPEDAQKRELRVMRRNAQRLLRLINQLLDLSKLEAGGMKLQASKENLVAFIKGMTMSFHSLADRKEILLDVHSNVQQLEVYFDREKLEKIIINLLSNAFKFTPDHGEITVTLSPVFDHPSPESGEGTGVRVSVRDTGIGIPPEKLSHIFDRFYQVDSSTTHAREGTGIGLALVKDLVELHHGTIIVTSEPGKGSEFVVSLPLGTSHLKPEEIVTDTTPNVILSPAAGVGLARDEESDIPGHPDPETRSAEGSSLSESETLRRVYPAEGGTHGDKGEDKPLLLVIEDNTDVREYIKTYLVPAYTVLEARDGAEGVEKAKEAIPDLIISDVMMPKMDGYEVCSRLKKDEKTSHIPIILLTAKASKEDRIGGLETGADDYLIKPFDSGELLVRVKNLIDSRRKLREKFGKELVTLKPGEVAVTSVDKAFLGKVMDAVEKNIGNERFGVEELAGAIGLSSKQLQRKLKGLADTTANDFIRSFRLQRAKELLQKDSTTIAEVAYAVGFSSPAYFTKCFQEQFGATPSDTRKPLPNP